MSGSESATRGRGNYRVLVAAIAAIVLILGSTIYFTDYPTKTTTTTDPTTTSGTSPCMFTSEGFLEMKVVNSSDGMAAGSLPVHVEAVQPACPPNPPAEENLGVVDTNASGYLDLSGPYDWYYLTLDYSQGTYAVNASLDAGSETCATLDLPSGTVNILHFCTPALFFAASTSASESSSTTSSSDITGQLQSFIAEAQSRFSTPLVCDARALPSDTFGMSNSTFLGMGILNGSYISLNGSAYQYQVLEFDNQSFMSGSMRFDGYTIVQPTLSGTYTMPPTRFEVYEGARLLGNYTYYEIAPSIVQYGTVTYAAQVGPLLFLFSYLGTCGWFDPLWLVLAPSAGPG